MLCLQLFTATQYTFRDSLSVSRDHGKLASRQAGRQAGNYAHFERGGVNLRGTTVDRRPHPEPKNDGAGGKGNKGMKG